LSMLKLYHQRSGARDFTVGSVDRSFDEWTQIRLGASRILYSQGHELASNLLKKIPFEVYNGTNSFGDDFLVLYAKVPLEQYIDLKRFESVPKLSRVFEQIARTVSELGLTVRFIAAELDNQSVPEPVNSPTPEVTSDSVVRALRDAGTLISSSGATSAVDRLHTAFHGYLIAKCKKEGIVYTSGQNIIQLFKAIRTNHPAFQKPTPRKQDIDRILKSMATIVDALNPVRNMASMAHPSESLIEEEEAMLFINAIRTLLHYLESKLR